MVTYTNDLYIFFLPEISAFKGRKAMTFTVKVEDRPKVKSFWVT